MARGYIKHFLLYSNPLEWLTFRLIQILRNSLEIYDACFNNFFLEDLFGQFEDNGEDLAIMLEQSDILEDKLGRKLFKMILKEIGRYDWVTKLEIYLAIGQYF